MKRQKGSKRAAKQAKRAKKTAAKPFLDFHVGAAGTGRSLTPYQKAVRKLLAGPVGQEIEREFGGTPEVIYGLRVVSSYLAAQVRNEPGLETFTLHDWSIPWATAVNQRLDREGKTETTLKSPWLRDLELAGVVRVIQRLGGGFVRVSFAPLADVVNPLLQRCAKDAPEHVKRELDKQNERNAKIEKVIERQEREGLARASQDENAAAVNALQVSEAEHLQRMMKAMGLGNAQKRAVSLQLDAEQKALAAKETA